MNSNPEHATPMLGGAQFYDDSKLQKRTSFLVSGLILCFVIAIAGLGVSVMVMMREKEHASSPTLHAQAVPDARQTLIAKQLDEARQKIETLQQQVQSLQYDKEARSRFLETIESSPGLPIIEEAIKPSEKQEAESTHHHEHMETPSETEYEELEEEDLAENIDMYFTEDGSGDIPEDDEDNYDMEGSGDYNSADCPQFAVPVCPVTYEICTKGTKCPVPVCCPKTTDHHHHHH